MLPEPINCASNLTQLVKLNQHLEIAERSSKVVNSCSSILPQDCPQMPIVAGQQVQGGRRPTPCTRGRRPPLPCSGPDTLEMTADISSEIDCTRFSCWFKLIRVSAAVLIACHRMLNLNPPNIVDAQKSVKRLWFLSMMTATREMLVSTQLPELIKMEMDGICYFTTRTQQEQLEHNKKITTLIT